MAGSKEGGKATAKANLSSNPNYYRELGRRGGSAPHKIRGFQMMTHEERSKWGAVGGRISRRGSKAYTETHDTQPSMERPDTFVASESRYRVSAVNQLDTKE